MSFPFMASRYTAHVVTPTVKPYSVSMESSSPSLSVSAAIAGMASANASMEAIASRCSREVSDVLQ